MNRILLDVAPEELDFIREALADKYNALIDHLNYCEIASQELGGKEVEEFITEQKHEPAPWDAAPYGYKKDGTPKKRPGRKVPA